MADQMRLALERAKQYYIEKLLDLGVFKQSDEQLYKLTLTDLESIYKKHRKEQ
jgi:hypothetical protein